MEEIIRSVEDKLSILEAQKAEIDRAIDLKRAKIKELHQTLEQLRKLESRLQPT